MFILKQRITQFLGGNIYFVLILIGTKPCCLDNKKYLGGEITVTHVAVGPTSHLADFL